VNAPSNNALKLTALSAPPALDWRRRFVLAGARTAPQLSAVFAGRKTGRTATWTTT